MKRTRIYIAAPFTQGNPIENVEAAINAADILFCEGYAPFVPHLCFFWDSAHPHEYEEWLAYDFEWLSACHAVLRLPGKSPGAEREVIFAIQHNIPVYNTLSALLSHQRPVP